MSEREQTLKTLRGLLEEVLGDEWDDSYEVEMHTSFTDDLELESIEFVALAEKVQQTFGDNVDFVAWLAGLELDEILAISVGDVVDFIERAR